MAGRGWERVMGVMPALPQAQETEHHVVPALIVAPVGATAPQMTDGVDAPGHMMNHEDSDQAAPHQSAPNAHPRFRQQAAKDCRNQQASRYPHGEQCVHHAQHAALVKVLDVAIQIRRLRVEQPPEVRMPGAAQQAKDALTVVVGRVGVFLPVAVLVMPAVRSNPLQQRSLDGHRAEHAQDELNNPRSQRPGA